MLIGNDVKLNSPSSLIGQALAEILQYPDRSRDALRVLLHLVRHTQSLQATQNFITKGTYWRCTLPIFAGGEVSSENTEWPAQFHVYVPAECREQGWGCPWLAGTADSCGLPSWLCRPWYPCCCLLSHCWPRRQAAAVQYHFAITTR